MQHLKIKKFVIITILNIIFIFMIFFLTDLFFLLKEINRFNGTQEVMLKGIDNYNQRKIYISAKDIKLIKDYYNNIFRNDKKMFRDDYENIFRPPVGNYTNNDSSILLVGDSFTYGSLLKNEECFHSVLSKNLNNRKVYNFGVEGTSPSDILYILRDSHGKNGEGITEDIMGSNNKNVSFVIYTFLHFMPRRFFFPMTTNSPVYKMYKKNNDYFLKLLKLNTLRNLYIYKNIKNLIYNMPCVQNYTQKYFITCMKEINREIKTKFNQNTKFVIFIYDNNDFIDWEELKKDGIIIIKESDILENKNIVDDDEYSIKGDGHPRAKAWQVIVPALSKQLNL